VDHSDAAFFFAYPSNISEILKILTQTQAIKFSPCSPGQIIEMAGFLGVDATREFYLLPVVRRAVVAPFPIDWGLGQLFCGIKVGWVC